MVIKLIPKNSRAAEVIAKHGSRFNVLDISVHGTTSPSYMLESQFPTVIDKKQKRKYWFWLACAGDELFDYKIEKDK
jgi:hypothetical protein